MTTELSITGMTCGHCVKAVEKALKSVAGAENVSVDLANAKATIDGTADTNALIAAVAEEGYTAQAKA